MTTSSAVLLTTHLAATAAMAGLIWLVQMVHYPLFAQVGVDQFIDYETSHINRTGPVVGPFMAIEGLTALAIPIFYRDSVGIVLPAIGLLLLAIIHASTIWLQVPAHTVLSEGYDPEAWSRLVSTNWIRTIGWSARTVVAGWLIVKAVSTTA
ncbi:MAG: hypothetical protein AAGD35_21925 [Actinomycetota bacterium]